MSDNGTTPKMLVTLEPAHMDMIRLGLSMLAEFAERRGEAESWRAASELAERFVRARRDKVWT